MEALEKEAMERSDIVGSASDGKEEEKGSSLRKIGRVMTQPPDVPDEGEDKEVMQRSLLPYQFNPVSNQYCGNTISTINTLSMCTINP